MIWKTMDSAPALGDFLVELEGTSCGSKYHVMTRMKVSNGVLACIGGNFEADMPKPIRWTEIIPFDK